MDRRQFLHSAAAAALTTTLPNSSAAAEPVRTDSPHGANRSSDRSQSSLREPRHYEQSKGFDWMSTPTRCRLALTP